MSDSSSNPISTPDFQQKVDQACHGGPYQRRAYEYIYLSISRTIRERMENRSESGESVNRHINAETLVRGLQSKLRSDFGYLAHDVMRSWGLSGSADVGEIVFRLADVKVLSLSPTDSRSDFCGICDFSSGGAPSEEISRQKKAVLPVLDGLLKLERSDFQK